MNKLQITYVGLDGKIDFRYFATLDLASIAFRNCIKSNNYFSVLLSVCGSHEVLALSINYSVAKIKGL